MKIKRQTVKRKPNLGAGYRKHETAVLEHIAANDNKDIEFDGIRAALGVDAGALPDGHIHQIALDADLGLEIV